jgi:hypothetical protein
VDEPGTTCAVETGAGPVRFQCPDKKVPLFLSENVPALSTFTWPSFGAAHNCEFWDRVLVYQPPF